MQNDDTHGSDQTQDGLDTVGQPAEHWAHADSVSGYGRPDPDEFGLPYPDQGLDPLIQELSPVQEQAATFQFG